MFWQITRNLRHLQTKHKISNIFLHISAHVSLHIFRIYAHILHHCRLVLNAYKFYYVNQLHSLHSLTPIAHQNQTKKKKKKKKKKNQTHNVVGTQGSNQIIAN